MRRHQRLLDRSSDENRSSENNKNKITELYRRTRQQTNSNESSSLSPCRTRNNNHHHHQHQTWSPAKASSSALELELEMESERDAEDDDDGDDEAYLIAKPKPLSSGSPSIRDRTRAAHHNGSLPPSKIAPSKSIQWSLMCLLGFAVLYLIPQQVVSSANTSTTTSSQETAVRVPHDELALPDAAATTVAAASSPSIQYACPVVGDTNNTEAESALPKPSNRADMHATWYDDVSDQLLMSNNLTTYLSVYRHTEFDNWGMTYEQVKEASRDWKEAMFAPALMTTMMMPNNNNNHNVDDDNNHVSNRTTFTIYESGCGIGLNLALTTEILYETIMESLPLSSQEQQQQQQQQQQQPPQVKQIELYGNDYVQASVTLAKRLYQEGQIVRQYQGRMGRFCAADSTHLDHVPSNAFDLVYTGYITPLPDPLGIAHRYDDRHRDVERAYQAICENKTQAALVEQMQAAQEDFFGQWVREMIRIARPGAPVIVEQVSSPFCEAYFDWGGVARNFWNASVEQWPEVDASSLVFRDDVHMKKRYHVYFRKEKGIL